MILVCAWCSRFLGMKEPVEGVELSHGICHVCSVRLNWIDGGGLARRNVPTLVISKSRRDLLPILQDLLKPIPEIGVTVDRRIGERRRQAPSANSSGNFPSNRVRDRRQGVQMGLF
jgi:hypothetical protein